MTRRYFITTLGMLSAFSLKAFGKKNKMKIHFLRHATLILEVKGVRILVDPMLSAKDAMDTVKVARNDFRIPMTDLPLTEEQLKKELATIDAVIVTHTHRDHWDEKARQLLNKQLPLIGQPADAKTLEEQGFENLLLVNTPIDFKGLTIYRTGGQHGTGEIGARMGAVSGFVIQYRKEKIYIAGDTIWCTEVEQALATYQPDYVVVNAGAAQFDQGDPITMTAEDVVKVAKALPSSKVIAVHMEVVNHCKLTRADLKSTLDSNNLQGRYIIPADGDLIDL